MSRTRGTDRRRQIPDMVSIHVRPPEIEDRLLLGHWEGDFIKGANNQSCVGVLVERTNRLVLLAKMEGATAQSALAGFAAKLNSIAAPSRARRHDRREPVVLRPAQSLATRYLRKPQRVAAQYLPKGKDLSVYSQDELDAIADSLNNRPRATHAFHSPFELFASTLASASQPQGSKHSMPCCALALSPPGYMNTIPMYAVAHFLRVLKFMN
jgi:transposase, IS30 family